MVVEGEGAFRWKRRWRLQWWNRTSPSAHSVEESYGARVFGRKITVSFFVPSPRRDQERTKPEFLRGGYAVFSPHGGGKRGIGPSSFFFCFSFFVLFSPPLKEDSVFRCGFFPASRRKHDGRRGRSEGATEAESRLFDAVIKREEAHDQFAKPVWHLHASRTASGRR